MFLIANGWTLTQPILAGIKKLFCKAVFSYITLTKNLSAVLKTCPHKWWVRHFIIFPFNSQTLCHIANSVSSFFQTPSFSTTVIYMTAAIRATGYINTLSSNVLKLGRRKGRIWIHSFSGMSFRIRQLWAWILALQITSCGFWSHLHQLSYLIIKSYAI